MSKFPHAIQFPHAIKFPYAIKTLNSLQHGSTQDVDGCSESSKA